MDIEPKFLNCVFQLWQVITEDQWKSWRWRQSVYQGHFPGSSDGKESACNAGDLGSISGLGRSPGEGHGNPLQYSCLEYPQWTEEPGRLQSMGSQRVRHNWATKHKVSQRKWHLGWDLIGKKELLAKALELGQGIWGSESSQWREILVCEGECETRWGWWDRQGPDVAASQRSWLGTWNLSWTQWRSKKGYF